MKANSLMEYKEKKGLSSKELADFLSISESYLSEILSGKRSFSKNLARSVSEKTGIPVLQLIFPGENNAN